MNDEFGEEAPDAVGLAHAAEAMRGADRAATALSRSLGTGLRRAMEAAARGSGSLGDSLRRVGADMARATLRAALAPVTRAAAGGLVGVASSALRASARAFSKGGVVDGATAFATRGGPGVAGEAGPEAILPLQRGADGRLGVRGGGAQVVVNITTPDAESFRRSEGQVAAALARAVARGQRRL